MSFYLWPCLNEFWFFAIFGEFCSFASILMSLSVSKTSILKKIRRKLPGWLFFFQKWAYLCFHHHICLRMHVNVRQVIWKCGNPYFFHTKPDFGKLAIITVLKVSTCWFLVSPFLFSCITRWYRQFFRGLSGFGPGGGEWVLERPV